MLVSRLPPQTADGKQEIDGGREEDCGVCERECVCVCVLKCVCRDGRRSEERTKMGHSMCGQRTVKKNSYM